MFKTASGIDDGFGWFIGIILRSLAVATMAMSPPIAFVLTFGFWVAFCAFCFLASGVVLIWRRWRVVAQAAKARAEAQRRAGRAGAFQRAASPKASPNSAPGFSGRSAGGDFREGFPDRRAAPAPLSVVPFALRLLPEKELIRVDVRGSIPVDSPVALDFVLTVEDITGPSPERVYSTNAKYQDEQTGAYVVRSTLGEVLPPGYRDRGWTTLAAVRLTALQTPFSGRRRLRVTCVGMSAEFSGRPITSSAFGAAICCSAVATIEVDVSRRGYVELRRLRERSPGTILCVGYSFAAAAQLDLSKSEAVLRRWMKSQVDQAEEEQDRAGLSACLEAAWALSRRGIEAASAASAIAEAGIPEAPRQALELCLEIADALPGKDVYPLLREVALGMGVEAGEFAKIMQASGNPTMRAWTRLEAQVGLDPQWPRERIRQFLSAQFDKWNARSASAREVAEREEIAAHLWAIAKLRQRYR
jgi:hypothetical protein